MRKIKLKITIVFIFLIFLIFLIISNKTLFNIQNVNSNLQTLHTVSQILGSFLTGVGLIAIWIQFKHDKELNEADFLIRLNSNFITNSSLNEIYDRLEKNKSERQINNPFKDEDIINMANYLTYFEPFYMLIQKKIMKIEKLDPLLSYRFFLATNNKYMQQMLLVKNADAFENIYLLYRLWLDYRIKKGNEIIQSEFCLSKYEEYKKFID